MTHYDRLKRKRLGDIMVDEEISTEQTIISALQQQQSTGVMLSSILLEQRELTEWELARVVVEQYQAPFIELKGYTLHKDLIEEFPAPLLRAARMVPLDRFGDQVCFACQEVPTEETIKELKKVVAGGIYIYIASAMEIQVALNDFAPVDESIEVDLGAEGPPIPLMSLDADPAWKDLFDSANDSVISGLDDDE